MEDMNLPQVLLQLAEALSPLLVALVSWAAYQGAAWIRQKTQNEKLAQAVERAAEAVGDTVQSASSEALEMFRAAAEDGVVTEEELAEIRAVALRTAKLQLGKHGRAALTAVTDDVDEYLWTKIKAEARVHDEMMARLGFDLSGLFTDEDDEDDYDPVEDS